MIVYVRFTPESGHRLGHSRRQLFANAAIEEPDSPPTHGSGQILTQLRLRRALGNCSGRFRDANLNRYDHLCEAGPSMKRREFLWILGWGSRRIT